MFLCFSSDTAVGCLKHNNRPLEFYDKDEDQPVCSHCVVIGERQTHAIVPIDDIVSASTYVKDSAPYNQTYFCAVYCNVGKADLSEDYCTLQKKNWG